MSALVFLPNWIGDVVMATPTLRALRRGLAGEELVGVMRPYVAQVLAGGSWFDSIEHYDPKSRDRSLGSWALVKRLRRRSLSAAVLLPNSFRTALLAWLAGAKQRIGYVRYLRGMLLTHKVPPPRDARGGFARTPMVDYYLALAKAAGCPEESPRLELYTSTEDQLRADEVWKNLGLSQRVVVINSSGAFGAAKLWPVESFAALARKVAEELDHDVLAICGPSERENAQAIVQAANHPRVFSLASQAMSLGLSKECVRRARVMVTTDSGPRHFAAAFGVPLVSLFGPTPPVWGENPTVRETRLLVSGLDCLGCHKRTCPLGHHRCMRELEPGLVFSAVKEELRREKSKAA